jgi:hypothetical protein
MSRIFVTVGSKLGDQISLLPIIYHWFTTHKEKPTMMVSRQYSSILDRVCYVKPLVYEGEWHDLSGALKLAKVLSQNVTVLSTYGSNFPIQHRTSSFQIESYERAGVLPIGIADLSVSGARWSSLRSSHPPRRSQPIQSISSEAELYKLLCDEFPITSS